MPDKRTLASFMSTRPQDALETERTPLSPEDEQRFRAWVRANNITDVDRPESRYDYRGYWRKYGDKRMRFLQDHFTDEFKQHGHESFSTESKYSRGPGDGGRWVGEVFVPAAVASHERTKR